MIDFVEIIEMMARYLDLVNIVLLFTMIKVFKNIKTITEVVSETIEIVQQSRIAYYNNIDKVIEAKMRAIKSKKKFKTFKRKQKDQQKGR